MTTASHFFKKINSSSFRSKLNYTAKHKMTAASLEQSLWNKLWRVFPQKIKTFYMETQRGRPANQAARVCEESRTPVQFVCSGKAKEALDCLCKR